MSRPREPEERFPGHPHREDYRSAYEQDRDRIVHSPHFRRLQSKTQVFQPGEYDFYRTRLTHSIEVAQIGRSLTRFLGETSAAGDLPDANLVEAVCLAHDLGHPPFGHSGERCLNHLMRDRGGFEGNAQTLRLVTDIFYPDAGSGMAPTRAFLDGILKYRTLHRERAPEDRHHHFLYDEQADVRAFVSGETPAGGVWDDPANRSLACQIMDWADDTAYCLNDIVDGARAGFLSQETIARWAERQENPDTHQKGLLDELETYLREDSLERKFAGRVARFIEAASLRDGRLVINPEVEAEADLYKKLAMDLIFKTHRIQQIEHKSWHILTRLFETLAEHTLVTTDRLQLLPPVTAAQIQSAADEHSAYRHLCDWIASLTDSQAFRLYQRLFDPGYGSITDLG
jgi:dGTPase